MSEPQKINHALKKIGAISNEIPILVKDAKGYKHKFASFKNVMEVLTPYLKKEKLFIMHSIDLTKDRIELKNSETGSVILSISEEQLLTQVICSETADFVSSSIKIMPLTLVYKMAENIRKINKAENKKSNDNPLQLYGSQLSYFKRYNVLNLFNLVSEDRDGSDWQQYNTNMN